MHRRALTIAVAALLVAQVLPVWLVRFQPLPDMPVHLAAVSIWHHYNDPSFDFARYYTLELGACPYWGYYLSVHLLAFLVGIDIANRIVLSLYLAGLPVGMGLLAKRFGRHPALGLFALPLAWNWNFAMGFVTFCVGLLLLPFALIAFDRFCERPDWPRGLVAAALGIAIFFCHLLPWGIYLGAAGLIGLLHQGRDLKSLALRALVWTSSLVSGLAVIRRGSGVQMGRVSAGINMTMAPFAERFATFRYFVLDLWTESTDEWIALALIFFWAILFVTAKRRWPRLHDLRVYACVLVCVVAYFVLPRSISTPFPWWGINFRFAAPTCLFLALCVPGTIEGWRRFVLAPVAAIALAYIGFTLSHWRHTDQWLAGMDELAKKPAPTDRVLVLQFPPIWDQEMHPHLSPHRLGALRQAYYGGYFSEDFEQDFPMAYKKRLPAPSWQYPQNFALETQGRAYNWLLVFQPPAGYLDGRKEATPAGSAGLWKLWRLQP